MDRVRFGRALGYGARHAARAAVAAAQAAAAPDPSPPPSGASAPRGPQIIPPGNTETPPGNAERVAAVREGVAGARVASGRMIAPVRRFSAVLWLEVTGSFFAIMALTFGTALWHNRDGFHPRTDASLRHHAWAFAALFLLFAYFSISSFIRAGRRGRQ